MSASNPDGPRWLIVVQQPHRQLYEILRDRFEAVGVVVIFDRRRAERRKGGAARGVDRRQGDRRQRRPIAWMYPAEASDVLGLDVARLNFSAGPLPTADVRALTARATCSRSSGCRRNARHLGAKAERGRADGAWCWRSTQGPFGVRAHDPTLGTGPGG